MFSDETAQSLQELFSASLIRFAERNQDVSEPPRSLEESLQHGAAKVQAAPFHFALFPEIVRFKTLERSFSSTLGGTFEDAAFLIGREQFGHAEKQYCVRGRVRSTVIHQIDQIIKDYETFVDKKRIRLPDVETERKVIASLAGPGGEDFQEIVDLFLRGREGDEHYFHMKTVKPNKDQSNKAKRLMLRVQALRHPAQPNVFFGMAYNPYGEGNPYRWSYSKPYFDLEHEVLIGGRFWDYVGGPGTFRQLMQLAINAGKDAHDEVIRGLGLGD